MAGTLSHQMRPYGWEGFQEYNLTYLTRARGLSFQGADVMYFLNADHLMLIELVRCPTGNLEIGMADLSEEPFRLRSACYPPASQTPRVPAI